MEPTAPNAPVQVIKESDVPLEPLAPNLKVARAITATGLTELGGGWSVNEGSGGLENWTLQYDEVLFVIRGQLDIETGDTRATAKTGEAIVIKRGTTVTYRGRAGSKIFYVLYPRDWAQT